MIVLVACEESQEVCKAFRARGHEAYPCDLLPCSGGHPEWHLQKDVKEVLFYEDGPYKQMRPDLDWDLVIAFSTLYAPIRKWCKMV